MSSMTESIRDAQTTQRDGSDRCNPANISIIKNNVYLRLKLLKTLKCAISQELECLKDTPLFCHIFCFILNRLLFEMKRGF